MTRKWATRHAGLAGGVVTRDRAGRCAAPPPKGAVHSAEIEYAMGNLGTNKVYAWTPDDYKVSELMEEYFANFVKTGNPNGAGLPNGRRQTAAGRSFMRIDVDTRAETGAASRPLPVARQACRKALRRHDRKDSSQFPDRCGGCICPAVGRL